MEKMSQHPARNGLLGGFLTILYLYVLYFIDPKLLFHPLFASIPYLVIFPIFMVISAKADKADRKGYISMGDAFLSAFITGALAVFLMTMFNYVLYTTIDPSLPAMEQEIVMEMTINMTEYVSGGELDDEQMDAITEQFEGVDPTPNLINAIISALIMGMFGAVPALIIGRVLRKHKDPYQNISDENILDS